MESMRFHSERAHAERAREQLPFERSSDLEDLVRTARETAAQSPTPPESPNPYALQPDTLGLLRALLDVTKPNQIVEFGAGESTLVLAAWAARHGARLLSVEHERDWVQKIQTRLTDDQRGAIDLEHAPLRLELRGPRAFLTYGVLEKLGHRIAAAGLVVVDGPHMSGREPVIQAVLSKVAPGAVVVIDDFRHYAIREMLLNVPPEIASGFAGEAIDDNLHGLYVLQCRRRSGGGSVRRLPLAQIVRSYWRCWRDFRQYGTGD